MLYPRLGKFGAKYTVNVFNALQVQQGKKPKLLMVTGGASFSGGATGNLRPANVVVYVADAESGNVAAYGILWSRAMEAAGRPQGGVMNLIAAGKMRSIDLAE